MNEMSEKTKNFIGGGLLILSGLFVFLGAERGEALTVLAKAVKVCLECIGIG